MGLSSAVGAEDSRPRFEDPIDFLTAIANRVAEARIEPSARGLARFRRIHLVAEDAGTCVLIVGTAHFTRPNRFACF